MSTLHRQAQALPETAGVYLFRDQDGEPLYIGKAVNLRRRVLSHLQRPMRAGLLDGAVSVDALPCANETEALLTEAQLIKRHRPPRNIRLRDDKRYIQLGLSLDQEFPRAYLTRENPRPGRRYWGPYADSQRARRLIDLLQRRFLLRSCEGEEPGRASGSPCLDYDLGRCAAPCVGYVSADDYRLGVDAAIELLEGRTDDLRRRLEEEMRQAAQEQRFEIAAQRRDALAGLLAHTPNQLGQLSADVIALAYGQGRSGLELLRIRSGQVIDVRGAVYLHQADLAAEMVLAQFVASFSNELYRRVLVSHSLEAEEISSLEQETGRRFDIVVPQRGAPRRALDQAIDGARLLLARPTEDPSRNPLPALEALQRELGLARLPLRIECVDISTLGGQETVAAITVLRAGQPSPRDYRRLVLGSETKPDDFRAMTQAFERRRAALGSDDPSLSELPDLVVVDGGRGQLSRALRALDGWPELGVGICALAKKEELVYLPGRTQPLRLAEDALNLLIRVRDETHRTAISHHRARREKALIHSILDEIDGVGPKRRSQLLARFGSLEGVANASLAELEAAPGISASLAQRIYAALRGERS